MAKLKVWLTPGCPYVMKVLTFINAAKLKDRVEFIQDSPEERKYLAEKVGKESAAMPAMELPDGGIIMFPEEVNPMHVNTAAPILGGSSCHPLPCLFSARLLAPFVFHAS